MRAAKYFVLILLQLARLMVQSAAANSLPDISSVPPDLYTPRMQVAQPEAGLRVRVVAPAYVDTDIHHSLYLPYDWEQGGKYPVLVEYAGNGPYSNEYGDFNSGKVEDCNLGYGISGGFRFIWICLPFISMDHTQNQLRWWGDVEATVKYCKTVLADVFVEYGGDPEAVFLAGFSRGAIACNFIGLHDE